MLNQIRKTRGRFRMKLLTGKNVLPNYPQLLLLIIILPDLYLSYLSFLNSIINYTTV